MSTSANIIFADSYSRSDEEYLDKCVSQNFDYVQEGNQIYIHWDGYPEHILPILKSFLKLPGAKTRRIDSNYLSAWFVTYYSIFHRLKYLMEPVNYRDYGNFIDYYTPDVEDILRVSDFQGIGFHKGEESDTSFTYVITSVDINRFNIWIYNSKSEFICNDVAYTCEGLKYV